jgi:5'-nucleotidase
VLSVGIVAEASEQIYKEKGLEAFFEHERQHARRPLPEGPFYTNT